MPRQTKKTIRSRSKRTFAGLPLVDVALGPDHDLDEPHGKAHGWLALGGSARGYIALWVVVNKGAFSNYQAVVPTTWNASPRDEKGTIGPYESSLVGNPVDDPTKPLEVVRTVHFFDPCMACACHSFDVNGKKIAQVKVL